MENNPDEESELSISEQIKSVYALSIQSLQREILKDVEHRFVSLEPPLSYERFASTFSV